LSIRYVALGDSDVLGEIHVVYHFSPELTYSLIFFAIYHS
jgi:hypothetical protein